MSIRQDFDARYVQYVGASQEAFPLVKCVIGPRKNESAGVSLRWAE
jgi:hypothetical protein